jgi:RimJ/RimL family protein N-acetyltransferase
MTAVRLEAAATPTAPALLLRPWSLADVPGLVALDRDDAMRRWTTLTAENEESATDWVREQQRGWEAGVRLAFAVVEDHDRADDVRPAGHVLLKRPAPHAPSAEVGYWTAVHARGRGVAPRALRALTDWAFAADDLLTRLELLHQADNAASCRVAQKTGYALAAQLPAAPPEFPLDGHLHTRARQA